jgi:ectoine hydroxylase-related dioxygenase (phytanoyl-CoA dioxygenase family)
MAPRISGRVVRRKCVARAAVLGECRLVAASAQLTTRQRRFLQDQGYLVVRPVIQCLAAMWCVTPFTRDSGPLRVIPASHRRAEPPIEMEHGYATGWARTRTR